ncbi:hypothetical protein ACH5RR_008898 [Cinchona calisaya]|uniref:RING-type E3 ubiquitin transferase n=1 Tax=Cinchona calisaya TaxID=153742 RepID=A0ABD3ACM8_9GENT
MGMEIVISVTLLLVGIAVLVIIHVCIVSRAFRRNNNNTNGFPVVVQRNTNRRRPNMSQDDIEKLPSFDYSFRIDDEEKEESSNGNGSRSSLECAVCLENFKDGEKCRLLPKCNHCFHADCIDSWLAKTAACPICRTVAAISPKIGVQRSNDDDHQIEVGVELT